MQRNDDYWGAQPAWQKATLRIIPNNPARIASLLAGDVQGIDNVPPSDMARLSKDPSVSVVRTLSNTVMFIHLDQYRDQTQDVTDKSGAPLPHNPFKDRRVRQAISKAINREALVERVMEGAAHPAGSLLAEGFFGVSPKTKPDSYDPDTARKLLAEAGYPNGFAMTIHGPNDRYINDEQLLQAIAPMLIRVGIETKVVALPWAVFIAQASAPNSPTARCLSATGRLRADVVSAARTSRDRQPGNRDGCFQSLALLQS